MQLKLPLLRGSQLAQLSLASLRHRVVPFWGPHNKDESIWGSILGCAGLGALSGGMKS